MAFNTGFLCYNTIALFSSLLVAADRLDDILLSSNGIFDNHSPLCVAGAGSSTLFSADFVSTNNISEWSDVNSAYEENAFEIDMTHIDTLEREWNIRIGKGGQIMSFIVKSGEAIPNQALPQASWNDLVQQMVAIDNDLSTEEYPNFIQSGVYSTDDG